MLLGDFLHDAGKWILEHGERVMEPGEYRSDCRIHRNSGYVEGNDDLFKSLYYADRAISKIHRLTVQICYLAIVSLN